MSNILCSCVTSFIPNGFITLKQHRICVERTAYRRNNVNTTLFNGLCCLEVTGFGYVQRSSLNDILSSPDSCADVNSRKRHD